jgi:hypothetical protein
MWIAPAENPSSSIGIRFQIPMNMLETVRPQASIIGRRETQGKTRCERSALGGINQEVEQQQKLDVEQDKEGEKA